MLRNTVSQSFIFNIPFFILHNINFNTNTLGKYKLLETISYLFFVIFLLVLKDNFIDRNSLHSNYKVITNLIRTIIRSY